MYTLPPPPPQKKTQHTYLEVREFGNLLYVNCRWTVLLFGYLSICPLSLVTVIINLNEGKFKIYCYYYLLLLELELILLLLLLLLDNFHKKDHIKRRDSYI